MPAITIRNLDDHTKERLRLRAARHRRSMEEEARQILRAALVRAEEAPGDLAGAIGRRFRAVGGVELELPPRQPMREPPRARRR
jgi:plasmid stability protein